MLIEVDLKKLECAINDFYNTTGMSISIFFEDYSLLASKKNGNNYCRFVQSSREGVKRCLRENRKLLEKCNSSKKTEISACHAGMVEIAIPILKSENVIGYMMLGHIKESENNIDVKRLLHGLSIDVKLAEEIYISIPTFDKSKIQSITNIASIFAGFILVNKLIHPKENQYFDEAKKYIEEHMGENLTVEKIAKAIHVSKNWLYRTVKQGAGMGVSEYINSLRIIRAKELLRDTKMSVKEISDSLGFSATAYFGKVFKKCVGISPLNFRKQSSLRKEEKV